MNYSLILCKSPNLMIANISGYTVLTLNITVTASTTSYSLYCDVTLQWGYVLHCTHIIHRTHVPSSTKHVLAALYSTIQKVLSLQLLGTAQGPATHSHT